jgi:carbamoyl-phosphate synthase small subunit
MVGYQEILSDPSYTGQMVVMTYPLIGNYGISDDDYEAKTPTMGGFIVREYNDLPSNFRYTKTLSEVMEENHIPGISGVDTRKLTRHIRENGCMRAIITNMDTTVKQALKIIKNTSAQQDVVSIVSSKKRWYSRTANPKFNVVVVDCGAKLSTIRALNERSCNITVVPYNTKPEFIESMNPTGIFIPNGPGNPTDVPQVVELIKYFKGKLPILGVDLGCQLIGLAYGAKTYKLKFGHRGSNHAVRILETGKLLITTQNRSYSIDADSIKNTDLEITHVNVLDGTVEGIKCDKDKVYGVLYHPEVEKSDNVYNMYDKFIAVMKEGTENA